MSSRRQAASSSGEDEDDVPRPGRGAAGELMHNLQSQ